MKIAYITTWGRRCGLSVYAEHQAEAWMAAGHTVWVLDEAQDREGLREGLPAVDYVPCWHREGGIDGFVIPVLSELAYLDADAVFFSHDWHEITAETLSRLAEGCHLLGAPLVTCWHNLVGIPNPAQEIADVDGHIVYHPDAPAFLASRGVDPARIAYVPHGCGAPVQEVGPLRGQGERLRLATFGLMYPSKGLDAVIEVLGEVRRRLPGRDVTLDIYSSFNAWTKGDYDHALSLVKKAIDRNGLGGAVNLWAGFPEEAGLLRALNAADVMLLLYRDIPHRLSSSASLPQALAAARPVVASQIAHFAGTPAMDEAHLTAMDVHHAAGHVIGLLTHEDAWQVTAQAARGHALSHTYKDAAALCLTLAESVIAAFHGGEVPPARPLLGILLHGEPPPALRLALRGVCVRPLRGPGTWEEDSAAFQSGVTHVLGIDSTDTFLPGWDLDIARALRDWPSCTYLSTVTTGTGWDDLPLEIHRRPVHSPDAPMPRDVMPRKLTASETNNIQSAAKPRQTSTITDNLTHCHVRIGVVIPTFRRPESLRRALLSVGPGVPAAVVSDDGPPALDVIQACSGGDVCLLHGERNHGASWARNRGVDALECAEWVQFLDDDDLLVGGWRESLLPHLTDGADAVVCQAFVPGDHALNIESEVFTSQVCVRRASFLAVGGFTESLTWAEERDLLGRMEGRGMVVRRVAVPIVFRPRRGGSGEPETASAGGAEAMGRMPGRGGF